MIGVIANASEEPVVREFFELFKTPWEHYRENQRYNVVLCATDTVIDRKAADAVLIYSGRALASDPVEEVQIASRRQGRPLAYRGTRLPIQGESITFRTGYAKLLGDDQFNRAAVQRRSSAEGNVVRIGYDLFSEVSRLLSAGQPVTDAKIPALELHIALLRELILATGAPLIEIPPVPHGYRFIACLTHDVDHPLIAKHKLDHTMFGFLYRAILGSILDFFRNRISIRQLLKNWGAACKLPWVYAGLVRDFWDDFPARYSKIDEGAPSTYFVIPFGGDPGRESRGVVNRHRAAGYAAKEIAGTIREIVASGCEVGVHGLDAWATGERAVAEIEEVSSVAQRRDLGVRMHWLYYDQKSPSILENAGANYDSTIGYRETIGYVAGTAQAYKPIGASRLLELPMLVMDTALFYPAYLNLSQKEAASLLEGMVHDVAKYGGCFTINWHDRSLAPERQWESSYRQIVANMKRQGAWFATAGQAVRWFRKRRSVVFRAPGVDPSDLHMEMSGNDENDLPGLRVRIYKKREDTMETSIDDHFHDTVLEAPFVPHPFGVA